MNTVGSDACEKLYRIPMWAQAQRSGTTLLALLRDPMAWLFVKAKGSDNCNWHLINASVSQKTGRRTVLVTGSHRLCGEILVGLINRPLLGQGISSHKHIRDIKYMIHKATMILHKETPMRIRLQRRACFKLETQSGGDSCRNCHGGTTGDTHTRGLPNPTL